MENVAEIDVNEVKKSKEFNDLAKRSGIKLRSLLYNWEVQTFKVMRDIEARGLYVNRKTLDTLIAQFSKKKDLESRIILRHAQSLKEEIRITGKVYTNVDQFSAVTGRIATVSFNFNNMPSELRIAIMPPEGYQFMQLKLDHPELAILAKLSEDEELQAILAEIDAYAAIEAKLLGRSGIFNLGKILVDVIIYGGGEKELTEALPTTVLSPKALLEKFYSVFPKVAEFRKAIISEAKKSGKVCSYFGRQWKIDRSIENLDGAIFNYVLQATTADMIKCLVFEASKKDEVALPIYNGLLLHIPANCSFSSMPRVILGEIDITMTTTTGDTWGNLH